MNQKRYATESNLFECIERTKNHLQGIVNAAFLGHLTPTIAPILHDDVSDILLAHIENLKS